ncbi:MAG: DUF3373 family protein [Halieaceae bacterium]
MKRTKLSLAIAAGAAALTLAPVLQANTVEELSAQLQAMQAQMMAMQAELVELKSGEKKPRYTNVQERDYGELQEQVIGLREDVDYLSEDVDDMDDRLMAPERHAVLDNIRWGGDFRFQAHGVDAQMPDFIDGMQLQGMLVGGLQQAGLLGDQFDFQELKSVVQGLPPALVEGLLGQMAPLAFRNGYDYDDDIVRTSRLRLNMQAKVADDVSFTGRLAMYKVWGDSTGVQVFNGQPTSINWDGTASTYPNSDDLLHVERAYFTWNRIAGSDAFLSIGRRPSTDGVPVNFRHDEPRGGTPMGSLFNYQFDGITLGYNINDFSTLRLCYGVSYESGWGNGSQLRDDMLDDAQFVGLVWDILDTPTWYVHAIVARAMDISDGFPATTILPNDPLTGEPIPAPVPIRYEPTGTIGDIDLAGLVVTYHQGPMDYFVSLGYSETDPTNHTSPFGGMLADPFDKPESQDGSMYYIGARYTFNNQKTKLGLEFNHGSKNWFNFALAEDDYLAPKTAARGDVWEAYMTHRIRNTFILKMAYIDYSYDYSGSGWLLGAPKDLDDTPILGFPTYDEASVWTLGLTARF